MESIHVIKKRAEPISKALPIGHRRLSAYELQQDNAKGVAIHRVGHPSCSFPPAISSIYAHQQEGEDGMRGDNTHMDGLYMWALTRVAHPLADRKLPTPIFNIAG